jgi:hypothetical protein
VVRTELNVAVDNGSGGGQTGSCLHRLFPSWKALARASGFIAPHPTIGRGDCLEGSVLAY